MDHWDTDPTIAIELLEIPISIQQQMADALDEAIPEEGCGLLAGTGRRVTKVWPIDNVLHDRCRYLMDAQQQLDAFIEMDDEQLDLLAVYHSHPTGNAFPSTVDMEEFLYPGVISLIATKFETKWYFEGYIINKDRYRKIVVRWLD